MNPCNYKYPDVYAKCSCPDYENESRTNDDCQCGHSPEDHDLEI